ncbi:MAG: YraN family protein [Anaerolineae bacterium]|nr:YraN family protein [Anaerolineae bacterium]
MAREKVGLGQRGESLAAQALQQGGFEIIARNWRCPYGEVDIVASRGNDLYFVEVRTRRSAALPTPEQTLTPRKHSHMDLVARAYLGTHASERPLTWHLGFVAVAMDRAGRLRRITFYPDLNGDPEDLVWHD